MDDKGEITCCHVVLVFIIRIPNILVSYASLVSIF